MNKLIFAALLALTTAACAAPPPPAGFQGDFDAAPAEDQETALEACVVGQPVCVQAVYCDERSAEEWEVCNGQADLSCKTYNVPAGEECFDGAVGHCDGNGACK